MQGGRTFLDASFGHKYQNHPSVCVWGGGGGGYQANNQDLQQKVSFITLICAFHFQFSLLLCAFDGLAIYLVYE